MSATRPPPFRCSASACEVWPIHTVQFSNHTGYGAWTGRVFDAALITEVVQGIAARGALARCDGVLSGYMGSAETGAAILDAVAQVKAANPSARYCCDPVIGDVGRGVFVRPGIPEFMREQRGAGRRRRHAEPVRARPVGRRRRARRGATRSRRSTRCTARAARRAGHLAAYRRDAAGRDRSGRLRSAGRFRVRTPKLPIASTARAMPSRRCSSRTTCVTAPPRRHCRAPRRPCSVCSSAPPRRARARSC
jgi:hypothetical protein